MPSKLAAAIRAKYPGAYDNIDDATLEKQVLAKYPQYQSLVEPEPTPAPAADGGIQLRAAETQAAPEGKSVSGFLGNILPSLGGFALDTIQGLPGLVSTVRDLASPTALLTNPDRAQALGQQLRGTLKAIPQMVSDRYGSLEKAGNTLYNDPAGVAADVSTVASLGSGAAMRSPALAGKLRMVSEATNPARLITAPLAKATDLASDAVIAGTVRPPAAVRQEFGGHRGVARSIKNERVHSAASAERKLGRSTTKADALLAEKQAAGVPGVDTSKATSALLSKPAEKAARRERLGKTEQSEPLLDRAVRIEANNPQQIPLTEAQALKREAQELAYESGVDNLSVNKAGETALAQALREGIEQRVPEVGPINEQSQRLLGAKRAFAAAEDRPSNLNTSLASLGFGGGVMSGDPLTAALLAGFIKATNSPRAGALTGIALNDFGRGMNANSMRQAALAARLLAGSDEP